MNIPTIYDLKPKFQDLLRPVCTRLRSMGITANQVTVLAMLLSILGGAIVYFFHDRHTWLLIIPLLLFVRMALNAIDGMLAREFAMKSREGAILNELGDVISDAALYLPFAFLYGISPPLIVILVISGIIVEMTGVVATQIGASRRYDGPLGKSDRAFLFGALGLVLGLGIKPGTWTSVVFVIAIILSVITIFNRSRKALAEVE